MSGQPRPQMHPKLDSMNVRSNSQLTPSLSVNVAVSRVSIRSSAIVGQTAMSCRSTGRVRPPIGRIADDAPAALGQAVLDAMFDFLRSHTTGLPALDAQSDFMRARRAYHLARLGAWLRRCGCCRSVRSLSPSALLAAGPTRLEVVPLHAVVGAVESTVN